MGGGVGEVADHQHPLTGGVVLGGEGDLLPPHAVDGHRVRHDVDLATAQLRDSLAVRDDHDVEQVVHRVVVGAEDGLRDFLQHVDVEALDLPRLRVAGAEQQGVGGDPDPQRATGPDGGHGGTGREVVG